MEMKATVIMSGAKDLLLFTRLLFAARYRGLRLLSLHRLFSYCKGARRFAAGAVTRDDRQGNQERGERTCGYSR